MCEVKFFDGVIKFTDSRKLCLVINFLLFLGGLDHLTASVVEHFIRSTTHQTHIYLDCAGILVIVTDTMHRNNANVQLMVADRVGVLCTQMIRFEKITAFFASIFQEITDHYHVENIFGLSI
jgi:hypothetical protein